MIEDEEKIRRGGPEEENHQTSTARKIEIILSRKKSLDLKSLFYPSLHPLVVLPPPIEDRVFLIEGAPGAGKSTLALHVCHQWAQGATG